MAMVSIVVPVYNAEKTLTRTIDSILSQEFEDFELVLVNDGSQDNSGLICNNYKEKDNRINVIHQSNQGPSTARNNGMKASKGQYLVFVDADDLVEKSYLSSMIDSMNINKVDLICAGVEKKFYRGSNNFKTVKIVPKLKVYESKEAIFAEFETLRSLGIINPLWNKLYLNSIIKSNDLKMNNKLNLGEDLLFNLDYIEKCHRLMTIPDTSYKYIVNYTSLTHRYHDNKFSKMKSIISDYREFIIRNNISIDYYHNELIRSCFSCFMGLFHKDNPLGFKQKLEYINNIVDDSDVRKMILDFKPKQKLPKILLKILQTQNPYLIYIASFVAYIIKFKIRRE